MENAEIMLRLEEYCDEIYCVPLDDARALADEIEPFCKENHVTQEQRDIAFAESGAGEVLYMLVSGLDEMERKDVT